MEAESVSTRSSKGISADERTDERIQTKSSKNLPECSSEKFVLYKQRWVVLAIFSLISMTNEIIWISLSSITSIVKDYYGVSYVAVNWLSMIYMLCYVFVIVAAYVLNTHGLKFTIVIGAVLNGLGSCLRLIGTNRDKFVFTFLGNAFAAFAQCFILFVPPTLAATWFGETERSTASAVGVLMNMLGVAIGFLMGGTMVPSSKDYNGAVWQGMFNTLIAQACFCTFMVVCCVIFVKNAPKTPPSMSQVLLLQSKEKKLMEKRKKVGQTGKTKMSTAGENKTIKESTIDMERSPIITKENDKSEVLSFIGSLQILFRDEMFHLVTQAYGLYFGLFAAYNTVLNQMCMVHYPGKEGEIGLMGFTSVILGLFGIFSAGIWLDKTNRYKIISVGTFGCCTISLLAFTLLLVYSGNFVVVFASFCIFGFFSYPYMTIGLEHAAELTYPVSEGTTSGILLLVGNMYGIILTYIFGAIIEKGRSDIAGYFMVGLYLIGFVIVSKMEGELKRLKADHSN